ncbi:MAG: PadR family transcriptional regulator [Candidatus Bathyarchaeia archaeon]
MKGLLDLIILQFLSVESMPGYQVIARMRRMFGVYFGPSTIYPLLAALEKKGYVHGEWNMAGERPRKIYRLTAEGQNILSYTENTLNIICQKISTLTNIDIAVESAKSTAFNPTLKKIRLHQPLI